MADFDDLLATVSVERAASLDVRRAVLEVRAGADTGKRFDIEESARIGARPLADVVLADAKVSGVHCEVVVGDTLRVRDLGSKNGSFVGGVRVLDAIVQPGDIISVGD